VGHTTLDPENEKRTKNQKFMICDSGATTHMIGNRHLLYDEKEGAQTTITMGCGTKIKSNLSGTLDLLGSDGQAVPLNNVLFVPGLLNGLFSVGASCDNGVQNVAFERDHCRIVQNGRTLLTGQRTGQHYEIPLMPKHEARVATASLRTWHDRLGHVNIMAIKDMVKHKTLQGLHLSKETEAMTPCHACSAEKAHPPERPEGSINVSE